jgi:LysM repeat protein
MKLVKIFGVVMGVHAAVFMFIFAIPGCRSTGKKPAPSAAPVLGAESSPLASSEASSPVGAPAAPAEIASVRFSPTRPGTPAAAEVTAPAAPVTYTVAKGDNLWSIAKKNGVTVKQLTAANNLRADSTLHLGQKLVIPGKGPAPALPAPAAAAAPAPAPAVSAPAIIHVIKSGETLGVIAKKYQVKVGDIATANNIADPTKIRVGQSLKIPSAKSPAAPAKSSATPAAKARPAAPAPVETPAPVPAAPAPAAPVFSSPLLESAPATGESPLITPSTSAADAPVIRVEESGAPRIE